MLRFQIVVLVAILCGACSSSAAPTAPHDATPDQANDTTPEVAADSSADAPYVKPEGGPGMACANIASACHDVDPGFGPLHDCHELGHTGELADCEKREAECLALCSGGTDASTD